MWFTAPSRAQPVSQSDSEPAEDNSKWSANTLFRFHEHFVSLVPVPSTTGPAVPIIRWEIALDPGNNSSKRINQSTTTDTASQPPEPAQHPLTFSPLHGLQLTALPQPAEWGGSWGRSTDGRTERSIESMRRESNGRLKLSAILHNTFTNRFFTWSTTAIAERPPTTILLSS